MFVALVAACDNAPTSAPTSTPTSTPTTPVPAPRVAPLPADAGVPRVAPTCIAKDATVFDARFTANGWLLACYLEGGDDVCWRLDPATSAWSFALRHAHLDLPARSTVTVTSTDAQVCGTDGADCRTVPLSGVMTSPDDQLEGAANDDRSIVAVWAAGPVHVFDAAGKRLTTIRPWQTPMTGGSGPSFFRQAHVLGSTIEVRIADTPVSSAIRLYNPRGTKIADVFRGLPMDDSSPPLALGGSRYAFLSFDTPRSIVIVDVTTGKQLAVYQLPRDALDLTILRVADNRIWVIGSQQVVWIDLATKKLAVATAPICK